MFSWLKAAATFGFLHVTMAFGVSMAAAPARAEAVLPCEDLAMAAFDVAGRIPFSIAHAGRQEASRSSPAYCRVSGYVAPHSGFELRLPIVGWNGKFLMQGCGGMCGSLFTAYVCDEAVARGYACILTDMGHRSTALDAKWAYNNPTAEADFAYRATHFTAAVGKAIVARYYGAAPRYSYFRGCSTGGRQALVSAQRFPEDFDGIIAGAPALYNDSILGFIWNALVNLDEDGRAILSPNKIPALHRAALHACDADDGLRDGIVSDAAACRFDPASLQCAGRPDETCLTPREIAVVRKIYAGPSNSAGRSLSVARHLPGSEPGWVGFLSNDAAGVRKSFAADFLRYLAFPIDPGPSYDPLAFDWDRDPQRFSLALYAADDPDVAAFRDRGGKLILYQGMADASVTATATIAYFQSVLQTMGGEASVGQFARLYLMPGLNHCVGGAGANSADFLTALEAWVEAGIAPAALTAYHIPVDRPENRARFPLAPGQALFSRPIFPFPDMPRYRGGDPSSADGFVPVPIAGSSAKR
jgi:feruloyl esterase